MYSFDASGSSKQSLERLLHRALLDLYDPPQLAKSALIRLFNLAEMPNPANALHRNLLEAVDAMKPADNVPPQANAWRNYRILLHRYIQQIAQRDVATSLGFSVRQLQRHELAALQAFAKVIQERFQINLQPTAPETNSAPGQDAAGQEFEQLRSSFSNEAIDIAETVESALKTTAPLLESARIIIKNMIAADLPLVAAQLIPLRQVFIILLSAAAHSIPEGQIELTAAIREDHLCLCLVAKRNPESKSQPIREEHENLELADQLITLSGGELSIEEQDCGSFTVELTLPVIQPVLVLFIDDNSDALQLFKRSLQGTRYQFLGTAEPEQALKLAQDRSPNFIVVDVMLPGIDGWELLGRLREHPATSTIPIIVSTILPYEQLALTIGASAFLRKPVSQKTLLETLDRLSAR